MCTQILGEKKRKSQPTHNTLKRKKRRKKVEKSDVYFSLSSERVRLHGPSRAIALVSLLLFYFLLSSSEQRERIKRAKVKDKNILVHIPRDAFVHKVSETQKSDNVCVRREKIFPEILRGQCSPRYIRLRVQKNPFDSHPHYESASTDTQTDRQISSRNFRSERPFSFCKTSEL